jgi:hypothetical protein
VKRLFLKAVLILGLFLFCGQILCNFLAVAQEKNILAEDEIARSYQAAMLKIMKFQEKKFKISYRSIPRLKFASLPSSLSDGSYVVLEGMYVPDEDTIYLNNFYKECEVPLLPKNLEDLNGLFLLGYKSVSDTSRCNPANVRAILAHELGHAYVNQLSLAIGNGNWPDFSSLEGGPEGLWKSAGLKLVSEGIAEYFSKALGGVKDDFSGSEWERIANDPYRTTYPDAVRAGFHFVKPILDKFGERGMIYLIKNPPVVKDMDFTSMPRKQLEIMLLLNAVNSPY